jgi:hypothetical protein
MPCLADVQPDKTPTTGTTQADSTKIADPSTKTKPAASTKPATAKTSSAAKPAAKAAPRKTLKTEAEISGFTSETSDRYNGRISLVNTTKDRQWWIKTGYGKTLSRTYGRTSVSENRVARFSLDCEYRRKTENSYHFVSAIANHRKRTPHSPAYYDNSGYQMFSAGYGQKILRGTDLEVAVAHIAQRRNETDSRVAPVLTLRVNTPVSSDINFDCDAHFVQPGSSDYLVDSQLNLTYKISPAVRLRLSYLFNNILGTSMTTQSPDWDKTLRLSLVFSN